MHVKIETEAFTGKGKDRKRVGAGSVIEVEEEIYQLNKSWMEPTDAALKNVAAAKETEPEKEK